MKNILKTVFIMFFFVLNSRAQEITLLNDSDKLMVELFKIEFNKIKSLKSYPVYNFKLLESSNIITLFQQKDSFEVNLQKNLSDAIIKKIHTLHIPYSPPTYWDYTFREKKPDSVLFIKQHRIDDYFFERDSLLSIHKAIDNPLYSISPIIFKYQSKSTLKTYAIVSSSKYTYSSRDPNSPYGDIGTIVLYERIDNKWFERKLLYKWNSNDY